MKAVFNDALHDEVFQKTGDKNGEVFTDAFPAGTAAWWRAKDGHRALDGKIEAIRFVCPCGCKAVTCIPVSNPQTDADWGWDGNETEPTLSPSIFRRYTCGWHGHLVKGEWTTC